MLTRRVLQMLMIALWSLSAMSGCATPAPATPEIHVEDAWSRPASAGGTGVVYVTITNEGGAADTLVDAQSEIAEAVELHETTIEDDVMRMQPVSSVEVPAGGQVTFEPGGLHVMLIGLKQDLEAGGRFEITLQFEESGTLTVAVSVR